MHLVVIGLNYKTAPVELREKLSISDGQLPEALQDLGAREHISECLILSTCNRTEVYAYTPAKTDDAVVTNWISEFFGVSPTDFTPHLYSQSGHKAIEHLFRVAAGVDSMVLGEAQILGQVKNAYAAASEAGSTGVMLNSLFQQAISVGKKARTETEIGRGAFSVGSVAVQLARSIFDELNGRTVLIIGAGEMGELTATHLRASGVGAMLVANRTYERAVELAQRVEGRAVKFEEMSSALRSADIVITSTGAQDPIITLQVASTTMHARRGRPLFFIDIAVPRDVEPGVGNIDGVFVYDIDDLQSAVDADAKGRRVEMAKVEEIVAQETEEYLVRFRTFDAVPVLTALREKLENIRLQELAKLQSRLRHLSAEDMELINVTTRSIVNKICHTPMIQIKDYANGDDASAKLESICDLFGICPVDNEASEKEPGTE
ncbi:MAG: glutamyl-tRNA reductase [Armatimonadetes bacterium]|nr:glutamyl-tRNA reductase [Armatimonadota bacterium]